MIYKEFEIVAEVITGRAEYLLNDKGELDEFIQDVDCEPEIDYYGVYNPDIEEYEDWFKTIAEAKQYIDKHSY